MAKKIVKKTKSTSKTQKATNKKGTQTLVPPWSPDSKNVRIYQVAKAVGQSSSNLLLILQAKGYKVKNAQNALSTKDATKIFKGLLKSSKKATSSSKKATPSSKKATSSSKKVTSSSKKATPSSKKVTPSSKKATPSSKKATPSSKKVTPSSKKVTPSSKKATPSSKKRMDSQLPTSQKDKSNALDLLQTQSKDNQEVDPVEYFSRLVSKRSKQKKSTSQRHSKQASQKRNASSQQKQQQKPEQKKPFQKASSRHTKESDGLVAVKVYHPDVDAGGGYITIRVAPDQIPPGAILVDEKKIPSNESSRGQSRHQKSSGNSKLNGSPVPGSILAAGRKMLAGKKQVEETKVVGDSSSEKVTSSEKMIIPKDINAFIQKSAKKSSPGLGSSFLQGLPKSKPRLGNSQAKNALDAAFSGFNSAPQKPSLPQPPAPPSQVKAPAQPPKPSQKAMSSKAPQKPIVPSKKMFIDGRVLETQNSADTQTVQFEEFQKLHSPHTALKIFKIGLRVDEKTVLQGHLFFWQEGYFDMIGRVNDSDPRPRVWAEEGVSGLGMEEREQDLQRWSMREWWDLVSQKWGPPVASCALSRVVRNKDQVSFLYEPEFDVYKLYQAAGKQLEGEHELLCFQQGKLQEAKINLDGVKEKERLNPEKVKEIFGEHFPENGFTIAFTAIPCMKNGQAVDLAQKGKLECFNDQLEDLFQFPVLDLPDPLGGTGSIRLRLGLWEMSQDDANSQVLREKAFQTQTLQLKASAGYISDLVRRELWRKKGNVAESWKGYTPSQIEDSLRMALRDDYYNMQGFRPKNPGEYRHKAQEGMLQIVLKRRKSTHSLLLKGQAQGEGILGSLVLYGHPDKAGLDPIKHYGQLMEVSDWTQLWPDLILQDAWLTASGKESRCMWSDSDKQPKTPVVRYMPEWNRGVAQALFLIPQHLYESNE